MGVQIIPYSAEHQPVFKELNLEWLDHYHLTETHDLLVLDDPQGTILDRGGVIYLTSVRTKQGKAGDRIPSAISEAWWRMSTAT